MTNMWTNPLTGSDLMPDTAGEILTAAVAYWEDVLREQRERKYLRGAAKQQREAVMQKACDRLQRFHSARITLVHTPTRTKSDPTALAVKLATDDLRAVMRASTVERAA